MSGASAFCGLGGRIYPGSAARVGDGSCSSPFHMLMSIGMRLALVGLSVVGDSVLCTQD